MNEPSMNSFSNNGQREDVKGPSSQAAGVAGDRARPFMGLAGSMMNGTSAVFAKFAKQILFVLAVIIGSVGGAVWYYKSSHPTSLPVKPIASTSAATGSPKDFGAQGDNGKAPGLTPAAPAPTTPPPPETPANPAAPLSGQAQVPPPPNPTTAAPQGSAPVPKNRLDASFFTDGQQQSSSGSGFGAGAPTINPALTADCHCKSASQHDWQPFSLACQRDADRLRSQYCPHQWCSWYGLMHHYQTCLQR